MQPAFLNKTKGYNSKEEAFKDPKVEFVIDKYNLEMSLKVKRNESLVRESEFKMKKFLETHKKPLAKNVIMIYIDAMGRRDTHRRLPKTVEFFR
jgi:hypothetical protein